MKHTLSVLVENKAGVLSRIAGLFSRRGFNIDSLAVGTTERSDQSRITIVVEADDHMIEQVEKQLNKQICVIKVKRLKPQEFISCELMLVKVAVSAAQRSEIIDIAKITGSKIVDISLTTLTVEVVDESQECEHLLRLLKPYRIVETVTTGTIALERGESSITGKRGEF